MAILLATSAVLLLGGRTRTAAAAGCGDGARQPARQAQEAREKTPVPPDVDLDTLRRRVEQGDAHAQALLGERYYEGRGVPQDYAEALKWFARATDGGDRGAVFYLNWMYSHDDVPRDYVEAYKWAKVGLALDWGGVDKVRSNAAEDLAKSMTPEQVAEAQQRARDWEETFRKRAGMDGETPITVPAIRLRRPPTKTKDVPPQYPEDARLKRVQGQVLIEAVIGPDGKVKVAAITRSVPALNRAALEAARQWEFTPSYFDDLRVPSIVTLTVNFRLR